MSYGLLIWPSSQIQRPDQAAVGLTEESRGQTCNSGDTEYRD